MDDPADLLSLALLLDLETTRQGKIRHIGALFNERRFERQGIAFSEASLDELDSFAREAEFILGHNLLGHDLPILHAKAPHLHLLKLPVIDTLYLSPLAFPQNPYHHLVKNYKLVRSSCSNPIEDARLSAIVFQEQYREFCHLAAHASDVLAFYHFCFQHAHIGISSGQGIAHIFELAGLPDQEPQAVDFYQKIFEHKTSGLVCEYAVKSVIAHFLRDAETRPVLAYCLAWLLVAGSNSVLPSWVRHQFPGIVDILTQLRDQPCEQDSCRYCRVMHNPEEQLQRFFNFPTFRDTPKTDDEQSLQRAIVRHGMADKPLLAILPTGAGKSLCFQLPALIRHQRRGLLTVVISPLQALMKDQVDNLSKKTGTPSVEAIYGMLTLPERGIALNRVRLGDVGLLYISPEQLRNRSVRHALQQREIGCWVFDEAHCLSKWGHDFRPDYLYVTRFIREYCEQQELPIPPVTCFTATAKQDVIEEILEHFHEALGQTLTLFKGGVERANLSFEVYPVNSAEKNQRLTDILVDHFQQDNPGSVVIYAATRRKVEELKEYLQHTEMSWLVAESFHGGLEAPLKRRIIDEFVDGKIPVICATNAFGMGIDKEDVRLVLHYDIPGSLENYLQEAGRAGRDLQDARCILLYDPLDIEQQFKLGALSEVRKKEIQTILKGLRSASRKQRKSRSPQHQGELVLTIGELLHEDELSDLYSNQDRMRETKVKTAIAWLERSGFLERNENHTQVFQGKPLIKSLEEGKSKIAQFDLPEFVKPIWEAILTILFTPSDNDNGFSADSIAESLGAHSRLLEKACETSKRTPAQEVIHILYEMAQQGLIDCGLVLSAFLRPQGKNNAQITFQQVSQLENALIKLLQETDPDAENGEWVDLHLRNVNQSLEDEGFSSTPHSLLTLLKSLAYDGKGLAASKGSLEIKHISRDRYRVRLQRRWTSLRKTAELRRAVAGLIIQALIAKAKNNAELYEKTEKGFLLVPFTSHEMIEAIEGDFVLRGQIRDMLAVLDRALMYLHEQHIITLHQGLAVFRQAMTIRLYPEAKGRRYNQGDYQPLSLHYGEKTFQVHVMNEYAQLGLKKLAEALTLTLDYFSLHRLEFIKKHFPGREKMLEWATSQQSFHKIVEFLNNPVQMAIVASPTEQNTLILAGPGSGKTRVIVHRCAYLLRVKRLPAHQIAILCFNHNAALSLRKRLYDLVDNDARGVTILTYHAMAMRLTGCSFATLSESSSEKPLDFTKILRKAISLLKGESDIPGLEADEIRDRLLSGYSHILVDEYQDIDQDQYELISALAGRTLDEDDGAKLSIMAVGDDDQNIYTFRGANIRFIRQFQHDYGAKEEFLVENYRSTAHIIAAANALIKHNQDRMKTHQPIRINASRKSLAVGGAWAAFDPVSRGRIQQLQVDDPYHQAYAIVAELERMQQLSPEFDWSDYAVLARTKATLSPIRACCEQRDIPVRLELGVSLPLHRVREITHFFTTLRETEQKYLSASELQQLLTDLVGERFSNPWWQLLHNLLNDYQEETLGVPCPKTSIIEWFYESLAEKRREKALGKGVFLSTIHAAKGLEFPHVFIADGDWSLYYDQTKQEEERRLLYVGMTRARHTLCLMDCRSKPNPYLSALHGDYLFIRQASRLQPHEKHVIQTRYAVLGLDALYLDYAGRFSARHPIHTQLANIRPGDRLNLVAGNPRLQLQDQLGNTIARLSSKASQEWQGRLGEVRSVRALGMIQRDARLSNDEYRAKLQTEHWEIPIVEIMYQPQTKTNQGGL